MLADPNMKCVCGYRKFRQTVRTVEDTIERWVYFTAAEGVEGGFGSTPFGSSSGSSGSGYWGLFELDVARPVRYVNCESCGRTRSSTILGGAGVFGGYELGGYAFAVIADSTRLECLRMVFESEAEDFTVSVEPYYGLPMALSLDPPETVASSPGYPTAGLVRAAFPLPENTAEFTVSLLDVCADTAVVLFTTTIGASGS